MAEKIQSWDALKSLRAAVREGKKADESNVAATLAVGMATCGVAAGAGDVMGVLREEISRAGLQDIAVISTGCSGFCYAEPMVEVREAGKAPIRYGYVDADVAKAIIRKHIMAGETLDDNVIRQEVCRP